MFRCGAPSMFLPPEGWEKAQITLSSQQKIPLWPEAIEKKKNLYVGTTLGSWRLDTETQVMSQKGRVEIGRTILRD